MGPPAPPLGRNQKSYRQLQKFTHSSNVQRCMCSQPLCTWRTLKRAHVLGKVSTMKETENPNLGCDEGWGRSEHQLQEEC